MTTYNHINYMQEVAEKQRSIGHSASCEKFFKSTGIANMDGLLASLNDAQYPCLVAEYGPDKRLTDNVSDNPLQQPFHTFFIVTKATAGSATEIAQARETCEAIADKVIAKMNSDRLNNLNGLHLFNIGSVRIFGIGPVGDSAHGVMVTFTTVDAAQLTHNPDDWF